MRCCEERVAGKEINTCLPDVLCCIQGEMMKLTLTRYLERFVILSSTASVTCEITGGEMVSGNVVGAATAQWAQ